jgi:calcineurin-like phosphoesterase family protein
MIWFTSDEHYGHEAVIEFCHRPFRTVKEMDSEIISRHNACVESGDDVYHLGDFAWHTPRAYLVKLNGLHHHLILGNHDPKHGGSLTHYSYPGSWKDRKQRLEWHMFETVRDVAIIKYNHNAIFCSHYAHYAWPGSHKGRPHLFGHSHGRFPGIGRSMDVGVDANNFTPISFEEAYERLMKIPFFNSEEVKL